jgi:hypothetical protein
MQIKNRCKPVSRILFNPPKLKRRRMSSYAKASADKLPFICPGNYLPDQSAYPLASDEQSSNANLCGISACKVYPQMMLPPKAVGSYPTFSPFHPSPSPFCGEGEGVRLFSVALSVTSTYFSALVKVPGSSPVHCSVLSGLSYQLEALIDSLVCSELQK